VISTTSSLAQPTIEPAHVPQISPSSAEPVPSPASLTSSPALPSSDFAVPIDEPTSIQVNKASSFVLPAPPSPTSVATQPITSTPPPAPPSEQPASPPPAPSSLVPDVPKTENSGDSLGMGITYDPFAGTGTSSTCKSPDQIMQDFDQMKDYKVIRIYGMGCNQIPNAVKNVVKHGQKLMAGAYMSKQGGEDVSEVIQVLKSAVDQYAGGNWDVIALFSVENERVNSHEMTVSAVVDAINQARTQLRKLGYNGPVGAVETVPVTVENPAICKASDVVMINCHAFFDPNTEAKDAGSFVKSQVANVKSACNNKRVVVTESGWPHQGDANGQAVPSPENQRIALDSIRSNFNNDLFLFNAFDDPWKSDSASTFNAEQYWGVFQ
jgi:exo-beta-1,3-glucanase (GH17 family)